MWHPLTVMLATRMLSMELFYQPGIEKQYKPSGFMPGTGETLMLPEAEDWKAETRALPEVNSAYHR